MSSNLYYRPAHKGDVLLSDDLKFALRNLDEFDNSVEGIYGESMIPVLRGMKASGVKDADRVIKAIERYGEVELKEEF